MKAKDKIIFTLLALITFCWIIYLVKSVLAPFICSLIIAYLLNPLVDRLTSNHKFSRLAATSLIIGLFFVIFAVACVILLPIISSQFISLIEALPGYLEVMINDFYPRIILLLGKVGLVLKSDFSSLISEWKLDSHLMNFSQNIFQNILTSSLTLVNILSLLFITPILIFYLLKDWDILTKKFHDYLPRGISKSAEEIISEIDRTLSGYIRGQISVCLIMGLIYAALLSFTGLNFGFLIGLLTGFFSFIPYVGMLCGVTAGIIVALFQWGFDGSYIAAVVLVFILGNMVESNFITPKLIGAKVGLHPVWVIFGLFFFGALFGFIGILIAVPLTAVCGVIIRYFALRYKKRFT